MKSKALNIRISEKLKAQILNEGPASKVVRRILNNYFINKNRKTLKK
jgi:hypothetical protein